MSKSLLIKATKKDLDVSIINSYFHFTQDPILILSVNLQRPVKLIKMVRRQNSSWWQRRWGCPDELHAWQALEPPWPPPAQVLCTLMLHGC